jgi:hypothetical protein
MKNPDFAEQLEAATLAYQPGFRADDRAVVIVAGEEAECPAGDALLCGLANQVARTHRRLVLVGDLQRPLLCGDPFGARSVIEATAGNVKMINPLIEVDVVERIPQSEASSLISVGRGRGTPVGSSGWLATAGPDAQIGQSPGDIWGAMYASALGAWFAFMRMLGRDPRLAGSYSLWRHGRLSESDPGPEVATLPDLGRVLQVGAGGVGAALDYWVAIAGTAGEWTVVDGDRVEIGNLNRQLIFDAADAGFPSGEPRNKAEVAAGRLGPRATPNPRWYGEDEAIVAAEYDIVLALANERGAREALQDRRCGILLHATTSPNYQAQFHRHLAGIDDCIRCRLPGAVAQTACATGPVTASDGDAALPFLSGLAGLLLVPALIRWARGELAEEKENLSVVDLAGEVVGQQSLRMQCRHDCPSRPARDHQ